MSLSAWDCALAAIGFAREMFRPLDITTFKVIECERPKGSRTARVVLRLPDGEDREFTIRASDGAFVRMRNPKLLSF